MLAPYPFATDPTNAAIVSVRPLQQPFWEYVLFGQLCAGPFAADTPILEVAIIIGPKVCFLTHSGPTLSRVYGWPAAGRPWAQSQRRDGSQA